jgi:hypothetical protein
MTLFGSLSTAWAMTRYVFAPIVPQRCVRGLGHGDDAIAIGEWRQAQQKLQLGAFANTLYAIRAVSASSESTSK